MVQSNFLNTLGRFRKTLTCLLLIGIAGTVSTFMSMAPTQSPAQVQKIDWNAEESPFGPNHPTTPHWKDFKAVRNLQYKASEGSPLSDQEVAQLIVLTEHPYSLIQARAISGLASVGQSSAVTPANRKQIIAALVEALESDDTLAVTYATTALGQVGDKDQLPKLRALLKHPSAEVRERAQKAIDQLGKTD